MKCSVIRMVNWLIYATYI